MNEWHMMRVTKPESALVQGVVIDRCFNLVAQGRVKDYGVFLRKVDDEHDDIFFSPISLEAAVGYDVVPCNAPDKTGLVPVFSDLAKI